MVNQDKNQVTVPLALFEDMILQVGILKEMYDKVQESPQMNFFQRKVLLTNKKKNSETLNQIEKLCENL